MMMRQLVDAFLSFKTKNVPIVRLDHNYPLVV